MQLCVRELVGENCITLAAGQIIHDAIQPELAAGRTVELDFSGVRVFASPFLNAAIGQLLRSISPDELNRLLHVRTMTPTGRSVLREVIRNARQYSSDSEYAEAVDHVIREQAAAG